MPGIFRSLCGLSRQFILTNPRTPRGSELEALVALAKEAGVSYTVVPEIQRPEDLPPNRNLLFTGSFLTALSGELLFGK